MSRWKTVSSWMQRAQSSCSGVVHLHCRPCKLEVNSVRESLKKNTILLYKCSCVAVSATIELSDALNNLITYLKPLLMYSGLSRNSIPKPQLDHVLRLTIELNSVIVIDAPSLGWWLCGFVAWRKKMAGVTPQTKLTVSLEVRVEMLIFMTSFKRFAGSGLAWSDGDTLLLQWHSVVLNLIHVS